MNAIRMPLRRGALPLIALLALMLAACTHMREEQAGAAAKASGSLSDGQILQVIKTINDGEIAQAGLVIRRGATPQAREAAQTIFDDHTASNERIQRLVEQQGIRLQESELSRTLAEQAETLQRELGGLTGTEFDAAFLQAQMQMHEQALTTVRDELLPAAEDPQIRQILVSATPKLQQHLREAAQQHAALESRRRG